MVAIQIGVLANDSPGITVGQTSTHEEYSSRTRGPERVRSTAERHSPVSSSTVREGNRHSACVCSARLGVTFSQHPVTLSESCGRLSHTSVHQLPLHMRVMIGWTSCMTSSGAKRNTTIQALSAM